METVKVRLNLARNERLICSNCEEWIEYHDDLSLAETCVYIILDDEGIQQSLCFKCADEEKEDKP